MSQATIEHEPQKDTSTMSTKEGATAKTAAPTKKGQADPKPTHDAKLTLESFILYKMRPAEGQFEFFPAPRQARKVDGRLVVTLNDVPFPAGVPHPKNALTALYGFRDSLEEFQRNLKYARENGMSNIKVSAKVTVRTINMGTTDLENLPHTDFLNLRRLQKDLGQIVIDGVTDLLAKEAAKSKRAGERVETMLEACRRPDLVCDVIRQEPVFSHIKVVAYMIPDESNSNRGRQVATILSDRVDDISFRGDMPFDIELPRLGS